MSDEVVVAREQELLNRMPLSMETPIGTPIHLCPSTFDRSVAGIMARMNAMGSSTLDLGRDGTLLFLLKDVLAYPREQLDEESGELHRFTWLVLIDPGGERWGTSSPVVGGKVAQLLALRSAGLIPWPVALQVVTRTARRSGRRYHDIVLLDQGGDGGGSDPLVDSAPPARPEKRSRAQK